MLRQVQMRSHSDLLLWLHGELAYLSKVIHLCYTAFVYIHMYS